MRLALLLLLAAPLFGAFNVSSPNAAQVVVQNSVPLTVAEVPAETDRVVWRNRYGQVIEPCGIVPKQPIKGCPQTQQWGSHYYTLMQGEAPEGVYAEALNVFGAVLATTATVTFTARQMGGSVWFLNTFNPLGEANVVTLQVAYNHPWSSTTGVYLPCSVDGRVNASGWPTSNFMASDGAVVTGPPYYVERAMDTRRFPNGVHEVYCAQWTGVVSYNNAGTYAFTAAQNRINTSTGAITLPYHPFINGTSTTAGTAGRVTCTTSTTAPAGLTCDGVQVYYVVGSVQSNTPGVSDSIQLSATVGGSVIVPSNQGSGTHTIAYTIPNPFYCGTQAGSLIIECYPTETSSSKYPIAYTRAMVDFQNGAAAMEMRPTQSDCFLTPGQTCSAAPTVWNTDGTTTAVTATVPSYAPTTEGGLSGCISVSTSGVITATNPIPSSKSTCFGNVLIHCESGACNGLDDVTVRVMVQTTNIFPPFSRSGTVRTAYSAGDSFFPRGMFAAGVEQMAQVPWLGAEMVRSALNYVRQGLPGTITEQLTTACNTVTAVWDALKAKIVSAYNTYGLAAALEVGGYMWPPSDMKAQLNNQGFDRQACAATIFTDIKNNGQIWGMTGFDEITNVVASYRPIRSGVVGTVDVVGGATYFSSVTVNSNVATFNGNFDRLYAFGNGVDWVYVTGATNTALNGVHKVTTPTNNAANTITTSFTTPITIANGTYSSSSDPGMTIISWNEAGRGPSSSAPSACVLPESYGIANGVLRRWTTIRDLGDQSVITNSALTSLLSDGSTLTVNWTAHGMSTGDIVRIWAASTANLNTVAQITVTGANSFTIPTSSAASTYNSGTDASLYFTYNCGFTNSSFANLMSLIYNSAGSDRPPIAQLPLGSLYDEVNHPGSISGWVGNTAISQAAYLYTPGFATTQIPIYGYDQSLYEPQIDYYQSAVLTRAYQQEPRATLLQSVQQNAFKFVSGFQPNYIGGDRPIPNNISLRGAITITTMMQALAYGVTGFGTYKFQDNAGTMFDVPIASGGTCSGGYCQYDTGIRHYTFGEKWNALALGSSLIGAIEKYYLQPRENSPYYGPMFYTAAHTGSYGDLLLIGSLSESAQTITVDLTGCRQSSGTINRYRLTARTLIPTNQGNPTSESVTFAPGEVVAYTCQVSGATPDVANVTFPTPAMPSGATKLAVKTNYYYGAIDNGDATDCTSVCSIPVATGAGMKYKLIYLDSSNVHKYEGDPQ